MKRWLVSILCSGLFSLGPSLAQAVDVIDCWFPPSWKDKPAQSSAIAKVLGTGSGVVVQARIARDYAQILTAFSSDRPSMVYAGSFVQSIIVARKLGTPLLQVVDGKEMYAGILILPIGADPQAVLKDYPTRIAYAVGASSGESSAKAATDGRAALGVASHGAAIASLQAGEAKGAMVKDSWWEQRKTLHPDLVGHSIPGISIALNPDNILSASNAVPTAVQDAVKQAALAGSGVFGAGVTLRPFDPSWLAFSLGLLHKGQMDPLTYTW
jgi:ABC-type phosphate/phosphonate transport system substrate-binding protein